MGRRFKSILFLTSLFFVFISYSSIVFAQTSPQGISLQGRIIDSSNNPLEDPNVLFTLQVVSPGIEECVLYEESHTVNMTGSGGVFALAIGAGTRAGAAFEDTSTLAQVFNNAGAQMNALSCASGNSYTPGTTAKRKIKMTFDIGGGPQVVTQTLDIQAVPYALYADTLQGKAPADFLQTSAMTTQVKIDNLATTTNYNELLALIGGTSTNYTLANGGNFTPAADVDFNGKKIVDLAAPTAATDAVNKNYSDTKFGGATLDQTGLADGQSVRWNAGASKWEVYTPATGQWVTSGSNIYYNTGNVGVGNASPAAMVDILNSGAGNTARELLKLKTMAGQTGNFITAVDSGNVSRFGVDSNGGIFTSSDVRIGTSGAQGGRFTATDDGTSWTEVGAFVQDDENVKALTLMNKTYNTNSANGMRLWQTNAGVGRIGNAGATDPAGISIGTSGNIGIGTTGPAKKLDVVGNSGFTNGQMTVTYNDGSNDPSSIVFIENKDVTNGQGQGLHIRAGNGSSDYPLLIESRNAGANLMNVRGDGNVGIGTATPAAKLDVAGDIKFGNSSAVCDITTEGSQRYNFISDKMEICINPGGWVDLAGVPASGGTFSGGVTVSSGGINITGGVDNNSGGITEAGNISGVGNITGAGATTVAAGGTNQNLSLSSSGTGFVNVATGNGTSLSVQDGGASTVNYVTIKGAPAGNSPIIGTGGADANINLFFTPKGSGNSIFTSGNVGIGTTTPNAKLQVGSGGASTNGWPAQFLVSDSTGGYAGLTVRYQASGEEGFIFVDPTDGMSTGTLGNTDLNFRTNDTKRITIKKTTGNVGIGTTSPSTTLTVQNSNTTSNINTIWQTLTNSGINIVTNYTAGDFTPGLFWSTSNNNATRPKAGIYLAENSSESVMHFGVSNNYASGITNYPLRLEPDDVTVNANLNLTSSMNGYTELTMNYSAAGADQKIWSIYSNSSTLKYQTVSDDWSTRQSYMEVARGTGYNVGSVSFPNGKVGIGTTSPTAGTVLDITGTGAAASSIIIPRDTVANRPTVGVNGMIRYASDTNKFEAYQNGGWVDMIGGGGSATSVTAGNGTVGAPSISFSGDPNTGFYSNGADTIGIAANGANVFNISSTSISSPTTGGALITSGNGTAAAPTFSFAGDPDTGWFRPAANTMAASTNGAERMRIDSSGNVGIGTASPTSPLHILATYQGIKVQDNFNDNQQKNGNAIIGPRYVNGSVAFSVLGHTDSNTSRDVYLGGGGWNQPDATVLRFFTAPSYSETTNTGVERMTILSSGNVGIGTTSPSSPLHVNSTSASAYLSVSNSNAGATRSALIDFKKSTSTSWQIGVDLDAAGTNEFFLYDNQSGRRPFQITEGGDVRLGGTSTYAGTQAMTILQTGNVGIGTTSPSEKLEVSGGVRVGTQATRTTASNRGQLAQGSTFITTANASTTLDMNNGNIQELATFLCDGAKTITLSNLKDGAAYTVLISGAAAHSGTCIFSAGGFTFKASGGNTAPTASRDILFTFAVINTTVVYNMIDNLQ